MDLPSLNCEKCEYAKYAKLFLHFGATTMQVVLLALQILSTELLHALQ